MKKRIITFIAILLIAVMPLSACKLTDDGGLEPLPTETEEDVLSGMTVVMSSKNVDITLYDFGQSYRNDSYYQYVLMGYISQEDFCDMIVADFSNFMYILNAAYDDGFELTQDERDEIEESINTQVEQILSNYESQVPEGTEDIRSAEIELLNNELKSEGMDFASLIELAVKNLCMYKIADKYYSSITESVDVTDEEVEDYIHEAFMDQRTESVIDFSTILDDYNSGNGPSPVYIPYDCFSVNHIYIGFERSDDSTGDVVEYDNTSRRETEAEIEALLPETADYEAFMELESQYGEDPGMDDEAFRENGYLIHADMDSYYYAGFVYAAMNLHDGSWTPAEDADYEIPELEFFELKDGTGVVKTATRSGIHYIIVNKEYSKGRIEYEHGDARWESWKDAAKSDKLEKHLSELSNEWKEKYPISIDRDTINKRFINNN